MKVRGTLGPSATSNRGARFFSQRMTMIYFVSGFHRMSAVGDLSDTTLRRVEVTRFILEHFFIAKTEAEGTGSGRNITIWCW